MHSVTPNPDLTITTAFLTAALASLQQGHPGREGTPGEKGLPVSLSFVCRSAAVEAVTGGVSQINVFMFSSAGSFGGAGACRVSWTTRG